MTEPLGDRPQVEVTNPVIAAEWLRNELGQKELSGIFRREGGLVRTPQIGEDGYIPAAELGLKDAGPAQVHPITDKQVRAVIDARYLVWRTIVRGPANNRVEEQVLRLFPADVCTTAYEAAKIGEGCPNVRELRGITHTPVLREDGSVLDQPGYDEVTGMLFLPDEGLDVVVVPDNPTAADIFRAKQLILQPIEEFPFVSEDDRATWIGLAMTPALRQLFAPPYQMGVITATNPGSGKTFLADMITVLHGGSHRPEIPRKDDELCKVITTLLCATTAPVVVFDNVAGVFKSPKLDSLLTHNTWSDRWLGSNTDVTAPNDRLWLVTGNNAQFGGDLGRRIVTVSLDPPSANHHLRTDFKIDNPKSWIADHRAEYLGAILTIARGWINAGRPSKRERGDSFGPWTSGLRGMLGWSGFGGTFGGGASTAVQSTDEQEWAAFLIELRRTFGRDAFTTKDVIDRMAPALDPQALNRFDSEQLPGDLTDKWRAERAERAGSFGRSLGKWMGNRVGTYADGWKLDRAGVDGHKQKPKYVVIPPTGSGWL